MSIPSPLFCLVLLLVCSAVCAEEPGYRFEWVRTISGPNTGDSGQDLAVDANGAVLVVGQHGGLDTDNDGLVDVTSDGLTDPLIIASRPDGDATWLVSPGGPDYDTGKGIALDPDGGAYVVGSFKQHLRFQAGETLGGSGPSDGYLAHYNSNGELLWARELGGASNDSLVDVGTDVKGNAFVIGVIRGVVDLDHDGAVDVATKAEAGLLLASFDSSGARRWARASTGRGSAFGRAIAVGPQGEVYAAGRYLNGDVDLNNDGRADLPAAPASGDAFIARFDADGDLSWARYVSGPDDESISALALAGNGDLLVTGALRGPVDFDGDGDPDAIIKGEDHSSFLARYTDTGKLIWVRTYTASMSWHVAANEEHIVLSGLYKGPLDLDADGHRDGDADRDGKNEGFVAILDNDGELLHVFTIVGPGHDQALAAGFSPDGEKLFVTGFVRRTADFDADGVVEGGVQCDAFGDIFLARYDVKK
jgi:hypothetical protein